MVFVQVIVFVPILAINCWTDLRPDSPVLLPGAAGDSDSVTNEDSGFTSIRTALGRQSTSNRYYKEFYRENDQKNRHKKAAVSS